MRFWSILIALVLNAVPALGWFVGEWSAGTTLVLYWLETMIGTILVAARIVIHRRLRPSKGHFDYHAPQAASGSSFSGTSTYLSAFLVPALAFGFAHGIFLFGLGFMMIANHRTPEARIDLHSLMIGLCAIGFVQLADFGFSLIGLRNAPFAWIERMGQVNFGRVFVIHLTIIGGMFAVMFTGADRNFFGVF